MQATETYNGWANRETWACHLWLSNDELTYGMTLSSMRHGRNMGENPADTMREHVEAMFDLMTAPNGMLKDIGSLWRVDWEEVADAFQESE